MKNNDNKRKYTWFLTDCIFIAVIIGVVFFVAIITMMLILYMNYGILI